MLLKFLKMSANPKIEKLPNSTSNSEFIKLSAHRVVIQVAAISGKDGDFWIQVSPSLNVSGYGDTEKEAEKNFLENLDLFRKDLFELSHIQRVLELKKMGWVRKKFAKRQFSKSFVDENGILKNLEHAKLETINSAAQMGNNRPVKTKHWLKFLASQNCTKKKNNGGSHSHYKCPGCFRTVTHREKDKEIPVFHLRTNLATMGLTLDYLYTWIKENC